MSLISIVFLVISVGTKNKNVSNNKSLMISFVFISKLDKTSRQIARSTILAFELNRRDKIRKAKALLVYVGIEEVFC